VLLLPEPPPIPPTLVSISNSDVDVVVDRVVFAVEVDVIGNDL
jgi:hypothetical protein